MTLSPGTRLGSYRIIAVLGAGGMGEVYAAEDSRLHRRVALKVLPQEMATDPERLQRFEREAQAIAALNHPNVVTIHSVEEADGVHFLTMELLEGRPLSELVAGRGLPLPEFTKLAIPLVDAVRAAHEHGIVHRDLKPANVMVTTDGRVKVLDFGLAKLRLETHAASASMMATAAELTAAHVRIMGTAAYMSPEQAEGRPVDHRSDIFSLGVVLYEMLTGARPFTGDTSVSVISAILKDTPRAITDLDPTLPGDLDRIVKRCLAKNPAQRYQHALDVRHDLEEAAVRTRTGAVAGVARATAGAIRRHARWLLLLALGAVVVAGVFAWRSRSPEPVAPMRVAFSQLTGFPGVEQYPSLSPDGQWVIYSGEASGNKDIYLQAVGGQNPMNLTTDSPAADDEPAFSPDGQRIAFRSEREGGGIFVMGRTGEAVRRVTRTGFNPTWSPDGKRLAFTTENVQVTPLNREGGSELWVADVASGQLRRMDVPGATQAHWSPHGQRIAYVGWETAPRHMDIWTVPADGGTPTPVTRDAATDWSPVWAPDGRHIYFSSDRQGSMNLWRVAIDESSGAVLGAPEPITTPAQMVAHPSVSADGKRIALSSVLMTQNIQTVEFDPVSGTVKGEPAWVTSGSRQWSSPDFSPDGQWLVFYSRAQPEGDVYVIRADGTGLRQVTGADASLARVPRWSPDGEWIAFFSTRGGQVQVWRVHPDGSGLEQVTKGQETSLAAWSFDGSRMSASSAEGDPKVFLFDPRRSWTDQAPETLVTPPEDVRPFIANSWSRDGERLVGQVSYAAKGIVTYGLQTRSYDRFTDYGEWPVWLPDGRRVLFVARGKNFFVLDTRTRAVRSVFSVTRDVIGPPRLSRDGRKACFSRRVTEADLWLVSLQ